nr:MAG TPA: tail tape measure protein [Caudoviricetes sp.]
MFVKIGVDDQASDKVGKISSSLKKGLAAAAKVGAAAVTAAATAIGVLAKKSLDAYADFEQLTGGVETLFKTSADTVKNYAANAYKTAGLSANEYMETVTSFSASLIQSLGGDTKKAAEYANTAITDMSDNANKMGTSIEMIQNAYQGFAKQNYTMLDNLKLGYGGTKEEMARLIADASKMTDVQKELGVTVDETDMSFANIVNAIHVVQANLDIMGTTSKEASTTIQGSISSMKSAWENLLVGIADDKQDFGKLVDNFVDSVATVGKNIMPRLKKILKGVAKLIKEIVPEIAKELPGIVNDILPDLANAAVDIVKGLVDALLDNAETLLDTGIKILDTIINGIIECIPKIKDLIPTIINAILRIIDVLTEHLDEFIEGGIQIALALLDGIIKAVPKILEKLPEICQKIIDGVLQGLFGLDEGVSNTFSTAFGGAVGGAIEIIKGILSFLNGDFSTGLESAGKGLSDVVGGILGTIDTLFGTSLSQWYDDTRTFFNQFGQDLYNAMHQMELAKLEENERLQQQTSGVGITANEYMRQGLAAADAFAKALSDKGINEAIWQEAVEKGIVTYDVNEAYQTLKETGQIKTATAEGTSNQINISMKMNNGVELARATAYDNSKANRVAGRQIPAY